jgi:hypothetical protein
MRAFRELAEVFEKLERTSSTLMLSTEDRRRPLLRLDWALIEEFEIERLWSNDDYVARGGGDQLTSAAERFSPIVAQRSCVAMSAHPPQLSKILVMSMALMHASRTMMIACALLETD